MPWRRALWAEQPGLRNGLAVDVVLPLALGLSTLLGGWQRVGTPGFVTMREYGGPFVWGAVLVAVGLALPIVMWGASPQWVVQALHTTAAVYALAALWFFDAYRLVDSVSLWPMWLSLYAMANQITRADIYRAAAKAHRDRTDLS